ncbi:MAG: AAA-like domain-containing protein [Gammaproteobacteria bacterium]|nr:AAA-like domain-containing protein [Gammaproteobacteria bacterium]MBU1724152.1 AAA-like domain-containing protein [Gammaproteobacteria bacterium]MBU2006751.1 AAA-like domain-containing protein [Gammaproteobacteria bacterium]
MQKHFNTSGPVVPSDHYCIDPMQRLDWEEVQVLIERHKYFVLHAPRQTGKTSTLLAMMEVLNGSGDYNALYVNIEGAQTAREDADKGMTVVCETIAAAARTYGIEPRLQAIADQLLSIRQPSGALTQLLTEWAQLSPKPIVLMLDEVDTLIGDTLISLLRQIRAGYAQRPRAFPQSIILCGVRDVRDYRIQNPHKETITGGSAFNIKAKSLRMGNFTLEEVQKLYQQHTDITGQVFEAGVFPELWADSMGQPWLVNALGNELTWEDKSARDRSSPITLERYHAARDRLIRSRATHLDQLANQLKERRVHAVVSAMLAGDSLIANIQDDDLQYVEDLGLITTRPQIAISNRIYQEIIPRELTWQLQASISEQQAWYLTPERRLDMGKLLTNFQQFFRENSDVWLQGVPYKEAGPHLILQAFLQRIVNGGGRIHREYALGRKRTDLLLEWPLDEAKGFYGEVQRVVIELKILRGSLDKMIAEGVVQAAEYARQCGAEEVHLVIFNRDPQISWDEKIWHQAHTDGGLPVDVWGA